MSENTCTGTLKFYIKDLLKDESSVKDVAIIIYKTIKDFGLTLANKIRYNNCIFEYDIKSSDDADTIGNCMVEITNRVRQQFNYDYSFFTKFIDIEEVIVGY